MQKVPKSAQPLQNLFRLMSLKIELNLLIRERNGWAIFFLCIFAFQNNHDSIYYFRFNEWYIF